jgi:hypothetical protein
MEIPREPTLLIVQTRRRSWVENEAIREAGPRKEGFM